MMEDSASFERLYEAQRKARLLEAEGESWLVYELRPLPLDQPGGPSLVFESDSVIRRVRHYPERWRELSDKELFALSWAQ